jgi:hypothetical protein
VYQLKLLLEGALPPIWRRVLVSSDIKLGALHPILQEVMGWTDSHLHMFEVGNAQYSDPDFEWEDDNMKDAWKVRLRDVAVRAGDSFVYVYDMGDGWRHEVIVEEMTPFVAGFLGFPVCLKGARACPPEDCGGIGGYENFLGAIHDPQHEEHEDMLSWIGGSFDPEAFDLQAVNKALKKLRY